MADFEDASLKAQVLLPPGFGAAQRRCDVPGSNDAGHRRLAPESIKEYEEWRACVAKFARDLQGKL